MIRPLPGYVLIEAMDEDEKTSSGFVLPEKSKEKPAKGRIMAIGDAGGELMKLTLDLRNAGLTPDDAMSVAGLKANINDVVIFHRWSGQDVKDGQKEYKLVKFSDLMGVYG